VAPAGRRFQRVARPLNGQRVELLDHSPRGIVSDLGEDGVVARPARVWGRGRVRVRGRGSGSSLGGSVVRDRCSTARGGVLGVGVGGAPVRGWAAADGARARGCVYEEVRARAAACPAHHPFTHDRPVATAVRVVLGAGPLAVGQDACGAAALDDARRRTTAATAVDTALHEKVLLGAVQLATALVGGGKPGQTELQRYVTLLAGGTGGKVHIVPCVVPCVVP
jgi:hypothetical protein